jgi:hypothetical protein
MRRELAEALAGSATAGDAAGLLLLAGLGAMLLAWWRASFWRHMEREISEMGCRPPEGGHFPRERQACAVAAYAGAALAAPGALELLLSRLLGGG